MFYHGYRDDLCLIMICSLLVVLCCVVLFDPNNPQTSYIWTLRTHSHIGPKKQNHDAKIRNFKPNYKELTGLQVKEWNINCPLYSE